MRACSTLIALEIHYFSTNMMSFKLFTVIDHFAHTDGAMGFCSWSGVYLML